MPPLWQYLSRTKTPLAPMAAQKGRRYPDVFVGGTGDLRPD